MYSVFSAEYLAKKKPRGWRAKNYGLRLRKLYNLLKELEEDDVAAPHRSTNTDDANTFTSAV